MPLKIVRNDITKMAVDAIVDPTNHALRGDGGLDGAIHRAAGPEMEAACAALGGCRTGEAKVTEGFDLPCKYVIHTVGPVWRGGLFGEKRQLTACYQNALALAKARGCASVAFPLISAATNGYPRAMALRVAVDAIAGFLLENEMEVYIVVFTREEVAVSEKLFHAVEQYIDDVYAGERFEAPREMRRQVDFGEAATFEYSSHEESPIDLFSDAQCFESVGYEPSFDILAAMLDQVDESFGKTVLRKIDEKGMTDVECYKRANIDRRLFNKIKSEPNYRPGKQTALAIAIALKLTLSETKELLMKAGFALSHSNKADIVVEYCIKSGLYDIFQINELLFRFDLSPLGY